MRIGVGSPTIEMEPDTGAVRAFATRVRAFGIHPTSFDRMIGIAPPRARRLRSGAP